VLVFGIDMISYPPENPLDKAAALAGGRSSLVALLGRGGVRVGLSALGNWKTRQVPEKAAVVIEKALDCAVTRRDLRPADWGAIWPELIDALHPWPPMGGVIKADSAVPVNITHVGGAFVEVDLADLVPPGPHAANDSQDAGAPAPTAA
jgi:DNA-binding transcriptional regulator YdaS (Cro superfamily)